MIINKAAEDQCPLLIEIMPQELENNQERLFPLSRKLLTL